MQFHLPAHDSTFYTMLYVYYNSVPLGHCYLTPWILLPASWISGFFITQQYEASACAMSMSPTRCLSFWESPGRPVTPDFLSSAACLILFTPPGLALSCSPGKLHTIFALIAPILSPKSLQFLPQNNWGSGMYWGIWAFAVFIYHCFYTIWTILQLNNVEF